MLKMWHAGMFLPSQYKKDSELATKRIQQYLNLLRLWDAAKEKINEYWFGTPAWKFKVSWIFPKTLARIFGAPNYTIPKGILGLQMHPIRHLCNYPKFRHRLDLHHTGP